jgi:hypothetical protein
MDCSGLLQHESVTLIEAPSERLRDKQVFDSLVNRFYARQVPLKRVQGRIRDIDVVPNGIILTMEGGTKKVKFMVKHPSYHTLARKLTVDKVVSLLVLEYEPTCEHFLWELEEPKLGDMPVIVGLFYGLLSGLLFVEYMLVDLSPIMSIIFVLLTTLLGLFIGLSISYAQLHKSCTSFYLDNNNFF